MIYFLKYTVGSLFFVTIYLVQTFIEQNVDITT